MAKGWGKILLGTRLEKAVESRFFVVWSNLIAGGLRPGDAFNIIEGMTAHRASNALARELLASKCDTLLMLDSDADVGPQFISQFRDYEPGWQYDVLQAFYTRRGWPPEPIWMTDVPDQPGKMRNAIVTHPDMADSVDAVGTHAVLIRREVFETLRTGPEHEWFYYPRGGVISEDVAFSREAKAAGFRLGATTGAKAGHISRVTIGWATCQEFYQSSEGRKLAAAEMGGAA